MEKLHSFEKLGASKFNQSSIQSFETEIWESPLDDSH